MAAQPEDSVMNSNTLRLLLFIVVFLIAALMLIESGGDGDLPEAGTPLLPELRSVVNDIDRVTISRAGNPPLTISKAGDDWVVPDRDGYPANVSAVRDVLLAMTEASVVEAKTANPELHGRLGVDAPTAGNSTAVLVSAAAGDRLFDLVFGNVAQGNYRYARIAGQDQSWLIDKNPEIPADVGDWLEKDIVDIDSSLVRSVTISHPDGETIAISKATEADTNFEVADVPEGRQLTYSTVANGIAGGLNDLDLDDVRAATVAGNEAVETTFETFDGMRVVARTMKTDDGNWLSLDVEAIDAENESATAIRARVDGWQYRIADYKANLLTRRWDDILEPREATEE
jgi:hypothetical protein